MATNTNPMEFSELQRLGVPLDGEALKQIRMASLGLNIKVISSGIDTAISDGKFGGILLMIPLSLYNASSRVIRLDQCRVELPWHDPDFRLLEDPRRKVPREHRYASSNAPTLTFDREAVLNHRFERHERINPRGFLEGMILGVGSQAIPDQYQDRQWVDVQLEIIDGRGMIYQEIARVMLDRTEQLIRQREAHKRLCARNQLRRKLIQEKAPA